MTLTIDVATPADASEIERLLSQSYPELLRPAYAPEVLADALPHITQAQDALLTSGTYYVVRDAGGTAVGAGGWTRTKPGGAAGTDEATGHIRHVVTDPNRVREGIGRALIAHIKHTAQAAGIKELDCYSTLNAQSFYAACGFVELGRITVTVGPGIAFPSVHMRAQLPGSKP